MERQREGNMIYSLGREVSPKRSCFRGIWTML